MFQIFKSRTFLVTLTTSIIGYAVARPFVNLTLASVIGIATGIIFGLGAIIDEKIRKEKKPNAPKPSPTTKGGAE